MALELIGCPLKDKMSVHHEQRLQGPGRPWWKRTLASRSAELAGLVRRSLNILTRQLMVWREAHKTTGRCGELLQRLTSDRISCLGAKRR